MRKQFHYLVLIVIIFSFCQKSKDHYQIEIGKYKINAHRLFNEKTQEIIQVEPNLEPIIIKFPSRVDSVETYDRNGDLHKDTMTTSYFTVQKIIDSINISSTDSLISSEIKLSHKNRYLKITRINIDVLFPDGTSYSNSISNNKISSNPNIVKEIKKGINSCFLVISAIYFINDEGIELKVKDDMAWILKY